MLKTLKSIRWQSILSRISSRAWGNKYIESNIFDETLEHVLDCQVAQKVKLGKRNMFIIAADHDTKLDLANEIFGTAEYKYVNRNQMDQTSTQLVSELDIYEEFEF